MKVPQNAWLVHKTLFRPKKGRRRLPNAVRVLLNEPPMVSSVEPIAVIVNVENQLITRQPVELAVHAHPVEIVLWSMTLKYKKCLGNLVFGIQIHRVRSKHFELH